MALEDKGSAAAQADAARTAAEATATELRPVAAAPTATASPAQSVAPGPRPAAAPRPSPAPDPVATTQHSPVPRAETEPASHNLHKERQGVPIEGEPGTAGRDLAAEIPFLSRAGERFAPAAGGRSTATAGTTAGRGANRKSGAVEHGANPTAERQEGRCGGAERGQDRAASRRSARSCRHSPGPCASPAQRAADGERANRRAGVVERQADVGAEREKGGSGHAGHDQDRAAPRRSAISYRPPPELCTRSAERIALRRRVDRARSGKPAGAGAPDR